MGSKRRGCAIPLIFIFYASTYLNSMSSGKVGTHYGDADEIFSTDHIPSLCVSDQYIMQSYFSTHNSLNDLEFRNFLVLQQCSEKIPSKYPNISPPTSSLLNRNITGEGSHRHLLTSIRLLLHHSQPLELLELVIVERLPLGVFADPFELQNLQQRRVFRDVTVFGDTNLELPSFKSNKSVVEIHMEINSKDVENGEINLKIPLHARYQPLEDSGYSRVEFEEPDLFLCPSQKPNQRHKQRRCLVLSVGGSNTKTRSVIWEIPAGFRHHTEYVSTFTFAVAVASAFFIIIVSFLSSKIEEPCKNLKQS